MRNERLGGAGEVISKKALVPRLRGISSNPAEHLSRPFYAIRPEKRELPPQDRIQDSIIELAVSDFQEVCLLLIDRIYL